MIRWWNEAIAALAEVVWGGVPGLAFFSFLAATIVALAWYFWPHWWQWARRRRPGAKHRRREHDG